MAREEMAKCPACGELVDIDVYNEIGDTVTCYSCDAELEIIKLHPPRFRVVKKSEHEEEDTDEFLDRDDYLDYLEDDDYVDRDDDY